MSTKIVMDVTKNELLKCQIGNFLNVLILRIAQITQYTPLDRWNSNMFCKHT